MLVICIQLHKIMFFQNITSSYSRVVLEYAYSILCMYDSYDILCIYIYIYIICIRAYEQYY